MKICNCLEWQSCKCEEEAEELDVSIYLLKIKERLNLLGVDTEDDC